MRPRRLELEGFSAFRERAEVDFSDAELFALVGPTGAGKSSVIDAMVFALYGSVPRYDSENLVHPVITQGAVEARVRLDFTVRGVDHTATRVVRRTKTGATTKEARLERFDADGSSTVLADDAKGLTAAVTELLGLDLEQFTKCVVLPQGAFAALLHDTKAKRQDLLVKLLDLGVYERIAGAARAEAKRVGFRIEALDEQLQRAGQATDAAVDAASRHLIAVDGVVAELDGAAPALAEIDEQVRAADLALRDLDDSMARLRDVEIPAGVSDVVARANEAAEALSAAHAAEVATAAAVAEAETERASLPHATLLAAQQRDHETLVDSTGQGRHRVGHGRRPRIADRGDPGAGRRDAGGARSRRRRPRSGPARPRRRRSRPPPPRRRRLPRVRPRDLHARADRRRGIGGGRGPLGRGVGRRA